MKKALLQLFAIACLALTSSTIMAQTYTYPVKGQQGFSLTQKTRDGMHVNYELGSFSLSQLNYRGEEMSEISIKGIVLPNTAGSPNLPVESRMMAIPQGANASLSVVRAEKEILHNVNIAPALRIQAETEEPDMEYKKDMKVYSKNAFYPENPFEVSKTYIRGVDAVTVSISPFQYNPVTKDLIVYTDIELSLSYEGGNGHFGEDRLRSPYWDPILAAELMNYDQLPVIDYEARMQEWLRDGADGAEYLIITPNNDAWAPYANQLKELRMKQGILTEVYRLDEMPAATTDAMKQWFHNAYHTWEIPPVAVCLLGDHGTNMNQYIPAEQAFHSSEYGNCITDNRYADAQGNDNLPDMVFSRLVAQNASELPIFVGKQIEYDTNPNMEPSFYTHPVTALGWQTERWFQLCSEVFGGYMRNKGYNTNRINCIYQGTPGSVWSTAQNTQMAVSYFGPNGQNYIPGSPADMGGWTGGTPEQVVQAVNNGTFWIQHRDHGLEEGWGEPAVRNSHIDQMNNVSKLPFVMSINCETGMFDYTGSNGNCFAEKWMRRTYNGQNAGAVGLLCPTDVSYSFVNDAYVWGVYDLFDGDFMPTYGPFQPAAPQTGNWMPAFGNVAGKYFLAQSSWPYNNQNKDITYTMFTAHCDAFLRINTQVPQTVNANHQSVQLAGLQTFQITAPEGTMIALTKGEGEDMQIVAVAQATGNVQNITIPSQQPPTILKLTITGQNYLRYETDIEVIPADGPYIIINDYELGNDAVQLNYGDEANLNIHLKNVGNAQAPAGTMTLTSTSEYVNITNGTIDFNAIASNEIIDLEAAFGFTISDEVPNKTNIEFVVNITSGDATYETQITLKAYAPDFKIGGVSITELQGNGNGRLDQGELVKLRFPVENKGNANSRVTEISLVLNNVFMQITSDPTLTINSITAGETINAEYDVYVGNAPMSYAAEYALNTVSGAYMDTKDFTSIIGLNAEDFEQGVIDPAIWTNDLPYPWTICNIDPYEGQYCLKSGAIGNNQETVLTLAYEVAERDSISFFYKVSSEGSWDKMHFYIDNTEMGNWSGEVNWTKARYPVNAGTHIFKWKYTKDSSVASGGDCCWIDFVTLPRDQRLSVSAGLDVDVCEDEPVQINGFAANYTSLEWTTAGDGTFDDATIMNPIYTPGSQDHANGSVILTLTAHKIDETLTDEMTASFFSPISVEYALPEQNYCAISEPQAIAVDVIGEYSSFRWTTSGSGVFENVNETITTYTPSAADIVNGVTLTATATSKGCGPVSLEYPFEMNPAPGFTMDILPPCVFEYCQGQDIEMPVTTEFSGFVDGQMTIVINGESYPVLEGEPFLLPTVSLEPGNYSFNFESLSNGLCEIELENSFSFTIVEAPNLFVDKSYYEVCQGESVSVELSISGGNPNNLEAYKYIVSGEGIEPFEITGNSYTLTLTPSESTEIHLTNITMENPNCGGDCSTDLDITIGVDVVPNNEAPAISGDTNIDARISPTSEFTVTNHIRATYSIIPEEAGTVVPSDNGLTVEVTWNQNYKGEATLLAMPLTECNNIEGSFNILVRNSTEVGEWEADAKIYPNPTSGKVYVEAEGMTQIAIFNTIGQLVYGTDVTTDKLDIDMTSLPAGSYIVRISTSDGACIRHLNVIR
ncbi:MAG: T9SS type A sorting domain-containing protein [Bacteroidales bacterium]|nr:T9SS type A sorting domain-containing protein [Bacteroidales bacterium]